MVTNVSVRMGFISDNRLEWYFYRMSNAVLNQESRIMAHKIGRQGTIVMVLHPGMMEIDIS